jgi:sulfur carrier protein ThiS
MDEKEKLKKLLEIVELNKTGYAGILPNGNIVDRKKFPNAIPVQENKMFGVIKPKKLK